MAADPAACFFYVAPSRIVPRPCFCLFWDFVDDLFVFTVYLRVDLSSKNVIFTDGFINDEMSKYFVVLPQRSVLTTCSAAGKPLPDYFMVPSLAIQ